MPAPRYVPDRNELDQLLREGWTHQRIADLTHERTGHRVTRAAVSAAINREGLTDRTVNRYSADLPWTVAPEHARHYGARMLRAYAKRNLGEQLGAAEVRRLDSWMETMTANNLVVYYHRETAEGFYYVERRPQDKGMICEPNR